MFKKISREALRKKRKVRLRKKCFGTADRPRMSVFRSNKNLYVQFIDDEKGHTVASVSTLTKEYRDQCPSEGCDRANLQGGTNLGQLVQKKLQEKGIKQVVFERSGYKYHGVIKACVEAATKEGLQL